MKFFTFNSAKYFYLLLWKTFKDSLYNKIMFGIIILGISLFFFTDKDIDAGVPFFAMILVAYMMHRQEDDDLIKLLKK